MAGSIRYRETQPGRLLRSYNLLVGTNLEWNFDGDKQQALLRWSSTLVWNNFWRVLAYGVVRAAAQDARLTRGGPSMGVGPRWSAVANLSSNPSNGVQWTGGVGHSQNDDGGHAWDGSAGLSFRPTPRWRLQADAYIARSTDTRQYVTALLRGTPETFGTRYVFGTIERSDVSVQLRLGYTLKPDLTLDVYAEPFAASGRYLAFGELAAAHARDLRIYGAGGTSIEPQTDGSRQVRDGAAVFRCRTATSG